MGPGAEGRGAGCCERDSRLGQPSLYQRPGLGKISLLEAELGRDRTFAYKKYLETLRAGTELEER